MARGSGRGGGGAAPATHAAFQGNISPLNHYKPAELPFTGHAGLKVPTEGFKQVDYYKLFLTQHKQTIKTARSKPGGLKKYACLRQWSEEGMNMEQLQRFVGLTLLMGLVRMPTLEMYWTHQAIFVTPVFNSIMTRNWYQVLMRMLHLSNNTKEPARTDPDREHLYQVCPLVSELQ